MAAQIHGAHQIDRSSMRVALSNRVFIYKSAFHREGECSCLVLDASVSGILAECGTLPLKHIDADATDKEAARFPKEHPARSGLAYTIDSSSAVARGVNKAQGYIFPPMWRTGGKKDTAPLGSLTDLALAGVSYTYRALILDLGPLFLMVQWLTHTSVQLYPRDVYEERVKSVNKKICKFRIGMALIFEHYVISFLSSDLVFQPTWASSREVLPPSPSNFYDPGWEFLTAITKWMQSRLNADRNGLACEVIRAANDAFLGIGVYTVVEIFFLAGLSPFLTEAEVFTNPSRVARFCGGYFEFLHKSRTDLWKLLRPAMKDGYLAPTIQQRLGYIDWLHVYAKDRCKIPVRMAALVDDYTKSVRAYSVRAETWIRYDTPIFYDVFEPTFLATALSLDYNLGHLIFGARTWVPPWGEACDSPRPFNSTLDTPTFLRPDYYTPMILDKVDFCFKSLPHRTVHTYRGDKQIWSITPPATNSQGRCFIPDSAEVSVILGEERRHMLFSYIVKHTQKVAIGPLEYCGNAHRISMGRSTRAVPCYGDPSLPEFYAERDLKTRLLPTPIPGERRPTLSSAATKTLKSQLREVASSRALKRAHEGEEKENMDAPPKVKRSRMSADQRLALGMAC
ncbi:hypothetical protein B0H14DRAFT_3175162 [Mycena olivaceomarginata]|nr:hypothetical protein B0H14DRAFT_3175162 [Mycena olivaceomarginata]